MPVIESRAAYRARASTFAILAQSLSPIITTIIRRVSARSCHCRRIANAPSQSTSTVRRARKKLVKAAVHYYGISAEIRIADGGRSKPIAQVFYGHDRDAGAFYQDANIKVTAIENTHFSFHKGEAAGKHKSYSYRFETPDRVIVFTGDTGPCAAVTALAKDAEILVTETSSCEDRKQAMMATAAGKQ